MIKSFLLLLISISIVGTSLLLNSSNLENSLTIKNENDKLLRSSRYKSCAHYKRFKKQRACANKIDTNFQNKLLEQISTTDLSWLAEVTENINNVESSLVYLKANVIESEAQKEKEVVIVIHGLGTPPMPNEWSESLLILKNKNYPTYYFKWNERLGLIYNRDLLLQLILNEKLFESFERITLLGHSTGGIIAMLLKDKIFNYSINDKVNVHTMASPIFGYGAPEMVKVLSPLIGESPLSVGVGANKLLKQKKLTCTHWVNVNCTLDKHACISKEIQPQLYDESGKNMPCGKSSTHIFKKETHNSIITSVVRRIMK